MYDIVIIGAGVIGAACAYTLSRYKLKILVLEKENDVAMGATRANSAIIHAGFDPEPGTLMARLNVKGSRMAEDLCKKLSVHYNNNRALVLGFTPEDVSTLKLLLERGRQNGVDGLELLSQQQVREKEPCVSEAVVAALWAPTSAIVDPWEYAIAMCQVAAQNGVEFRFDEKVTSINKTNEGYAVFTGDQSFNARYVINTAGVHSDEIHNMVAPKAFTIRPTRGDYCVLDKPESKKASCTLFQCPSKDGKGVLVSPTVHGNLLAGPNAVQSEDPDRVNTTAEGIDFVKKMALKSVPGIDFRQTIRQYAGMRANSDCSDFVIGFAEDGFLDLAGIKSPGLSAAPAIALEAKKLLGEDGLTLTPNPEAVTERKKKLFKHMTTEEKQKAIEENHLYGRVICRCETVTEGDILNALRSPLPPHTLDGVKRRVGAGMGRCQGGLCSPRVLEILSRELGICPTEILKDKAGSVILMSETKGEAN